MTNQAEANLSALIESREDLLWSVDLNYALLSFNRAMQLYLERNFGVQAVIGKRQADLVPPERSAIWPPLFERALSEGPFRTEVPFPEGRTLEVLFNPIVVDGKTTGISVFGKDITERKAAEKALQEAERKYREIFDGALEGIFQTSPDARVLMANSSLAKILGYDSPEDILSNIENVVQDVWADREEHARFRKQLAESGSLRGFEARFKHKNGAIIWCALSCRMVCGPEGDLHYIEGFLEDITDRKAAESALLEAEKKYRAIFDGALEGMYQTTAGGKLLAVNASLARMLGYASADELLSSVQDVAQSIWADPNERGELLRLLEVTGALLGFECEFKRKDGSVFWVSLSCKAVYGQDGRVLYLEGSIEDITGRKQAALALAESEARFRRFFEENGSVMIIIEPATGKIVDANLAAAAYYGYSREELIGMPIERINTLPMEEVALERERALRRERNRFEFRHRLANGEERIVEVYSSPMPVGSRRLLFSVVHDITERKRTEDALHESLESLEVAQKIGGLGTYSLDIPTGNWTSSHVLDELLGIDRDYDHTVEGWTGLIHPDDQSAMAAYFLNEVVGKGVPFDKEYRIVRRSDGVVRRLHGLGKLEFDAEGRPSKMHGVIKDITEQKQAEMELRNSEERFRATFEQAAVGMLHTSLDGKILRCNGRFAEIVGYPLDTVPGLTFQQITHPDDLRESLDILEQVLKGTTIEACWEKRYVRKDGSLTWVKLSTSLQKDGEGRPLHLISVVEDINDRKAAEEKLATAQTALQASEERYRTAFQTNLDASAITRMDDSMILEVNKAFTEMYGYEREEAVGRTAYELGIWPDPEQRRALVAMVKERLICRDLEVKLKRKDGGTFWGLMSAWVLEIDGISCMQAGVRDISAAKAAEEKLTTAQEALKASEARYRTAFQTSLDSISINRLDDGLYIDASPSFLDVMGYTREEVVGKTSLELNIWVYPAEREYMASTLREKGMIQNLESRFRRKDGTVFWGLSSATRIVLDGVACLLCVIRDITATKAAAEALKTSEERYRTAFQTSHDGISITRLEDGLYIDVNHAFLRTFGYKREEVIGQTSLELHIWADPGDRSKMVEVLRKNSLYENFEVRFQRKSGQAFWVLVSASIILLDGVSCVLFVIRDISAAKAASERLATAVEALRASESRYRTAFETSLDSININRLSDGTYIEVNKAFLDVVGYERHEVIGRTPKELGLWDDPRDQENLIEILRQDSHCRDFEAQFRRRNGEVFWGLMSASLIELDGVPCVLTMTRDISNAKLAEDKIRNLAFYDPLTGLPNRRLLMERLQQALASSTRSSNMRVLMFVDLDNFKNLNDTLGHQAGDLLLQEIARRLTSCVRDSDTVARLGGDEFVILLEGLSEFARDAASQAKAVAEKILAAIGQPYELDGRECFSTSSIGITVFGHHRESMNDVMQQADIAMYQAKAAGRNTLRFFAPALQAAVNARAAMEDDLRQALKAGQFLLLYQPQVESSRLVGAEALVRWKHPARGFLLPGEFITLAEETGLILPLGNWVLETACRQIAAWGESTESAHIKLAVNISARQFRQPNFIQQVLTIIERTGANPQNLQLELTESMLVENIDDVIEIMAELKSHGVRFSLDDFGTGYSSLSYLKHLPLDQLKIDRSFVRDMLTDVSSGAIAQTLISLGSAMGLSVIAEGVETEEQLVFLADLGCRTFQGYLFGRPLPLEEFRIKWTNCPVNGKES